MSIFLSYRRIDSSQALWLYPWLVEWFGRERVFWDRADIRVGERFAIIIEQQIRSSRAFIPLISTNWLSAIDDEGHRRIDLPDDWIRRETSLALDEGLLVLPVLVGPARPLAADDLPTDLRRLSDLHMLSMTDHRFFDVLRAQLETVVTPAVDAGLGPPQDELLQRRAGNLLRRQIQRLQVRAVELIQDGRIDRAGEELTEGAELLMTLLDLLPGDQTLDVQLGYLFFTTGQSFQAAGNRDEAEPYFDLSTSIFERVRANPAVLQDRPADRASAIKGLGGVRFERGDAEGAIECYREALSLAPEYGYAWHDLLLAYLQLAEEGDIRLAELRAAFDATRRFGVAVPGIGTTQIALLERAVARFDGECAGALLERARTDGSRPDMAAAYEHLATIAHREGDDQQALASAQAALTLLEDLGDERALARVSGLLGEIHVTLGNSQEAGDAYRDAEARYTRLGDDASAAKVRDAGISGRLAVAMRRKQAERARLADIVRESEAELAVLTYDDNPEEWTRATYARGLALRWLGSSEAGLDEAIACFDRLLAVLDRAESPEEWAMVMRSRGAAYQILGEKRPGATAEAVRCYDLALEVFTRDAYPDDWAGLMMSRGVALQFPCTGEAPDLAEAIRAYDRALEVITRVEKPNDCERMMFNRAAAFRALQGPDRAANLQEAGRSFEAVVAVNGTYAPLAKGALAAVRRELQQLDAASSGAAEAENL